MRAGAPRVPMRVRMAGILLFAVVAGPTHAQSATSRSCLAEVKKLQNSPEMRVQGGLPAQVNGRANAAAFLQQAAAAAAQKDEKTCRDYLKRAQVALMF